MACDIAAMVHQALTIPHRTRAERVAAGANYWREIACRSCGRWMTLRRDDDRWHHDHDDTVACVDPVTLEPYPLDAM